MQKAWGNRSFYRKAVQKGKTMFERNCFEHEELNKDIRKGFIRVQQMLQILQKNFNVATSAQENVRSLRN